MAALTSEFGAGSLPGTAKSSPHAHLGSTAVTTMAHTIDLSGYGISDAAEIIHNPSYELLFAEETRKDLQGYEKGLVTGVRRSGRAHRHLHGAFTEGQVHCPGRYQQHTSGGTRRNHPMTTSRSRPRTGQCSKAW